jgi:hypothetical protein
VAYQSANPSESSTGGASPEELMLRLSAAHITTQALNVFAGLGIPDLLRKEPLHIREIARLTESNESVLYRLLRFLASVECLRQETDGRFSLMPLGRTLCSRPISVIRDNLLLLASPFYWSTVGNLLHAVKTGGNAFEHAHGEPLFELLKSRPEEAVVFNATMDSSSRLGVAAILSAYDFSSFREIVDVAGGKGGLLTSILSKMPNARGVLYDSPTVLEDLEVDQSIAARFSKIGGSFFETIPPGADLYLMRRVLHDWCDEQAIAILSKCREAIAADGKLLIIELAAPAEATSSNTWAENDLLMLLLFNGRERSAAEFEEILKPSGFALNRVIRTLSALWIIEASPV